MDDLFNRLSLLASIGVPPVGATGKPLSSYELHVREEALSTFVDIPSALWNFKTRSGTREEVEAGIKAIEDYRQAVLNRRTRPDWSVQDFHAYDLDPIRDVEEVDYKGPGPYRVEAVDRIGDAVGEDLSWLTTINGYPSEEVRKWVCSRRNKKGEVVGHFVNIACPKILRDVVQHLVDWMDTPHHITTEGLEPFEADVLSR